MNIDYQQRVLLAAAELAKAKQSMDGYDFFWKENKLVINPTRQEEKAVIGLDSVTVTQKGMEGADAQLISLLEQKVVLMAEPIDAFHMGYEHGLSGKTPIPNAPLSYHFGHEKASESTKRPV